MIVLLFTITLGAVVGAIYSLYGFGLVLTYRTSGVFNFALGAIGMFYAFLFYQLSQGGSVNLLLGSYTQTWRMPVGFALPLVLLVLAPLGGWALNVALFRKLRSLGSLIQIVATIGTMISFIGLVSVVWTGNTTLVPIAVVDPNGVIRWGNGFVVTIPQIVAFAVVIVSCIALMAFLRYSRIGVQMRATVDRPELAETMGINTNRVSSTAWAVSSAFAALAGILIAPFYGGLDIPTLSLLVVVATAAAVIGKLQSIPLTLAGGLMVGIGQFLVERYVHGNLAENLRPSIPFLVLFIVLFLPIRWPDPGFTVAPSRGTIEQSVPTASRTAIRLCVLTAVLVVPVFFATGLLTRLFGGGWQGVYALVPGMALIFLSLTVLTGYAGQISLCQGALAGLGAFSAGHLLNDLHWPFPLAAFVAALMVVPVGALLASRATQLPTIFLGLATLAFGAFMDKFAFNDLWFANGSQGIQLDPVHLISSGRVFFLVGLVVFGFCAFLVSNLRKGRTGLALAAVRDTQVGVASLGSNVAALKFASFCLSAFLAALGGVFLSQARLVVTAADFNSVTSLTILAVAVIAGISTWPGALLGGIILSLSPALLARPFFEQNIVFETLFHGQLVNLLPVLFGLGAIQLASNPHGIIEQTKAQFTKLMAQIRTIRRPSGGSLKPASAIVGSDPTLAPPTPSIVAFAEGTLYHNNTCLLARETVGRTMIDWKSAQNLRPCPVCEPKVESSWSR
jgi:branched-chain amino acid transport system permease protein